MKNVQLNKPKKLALEGTVANFDSFAFFFGLQRRSREEERKENCKLGSRPLSLGARRG